MIDARVALAFAAVLFFVLAPDVTQAQPAPSPAVPSESPSAIPSPSPTASPSIPSSPSPVPSASPVPAGVVPPSVYVELAGTVSPAFALARIQTIIAAAAQLRPGAAVTISGVTITQPLVPGSLLQAQALTTLHGNGQWTDVSGFTSVSVQVDALSILDPQILYYSDDPERITTDGVVFRSTISVDRSRAGRVYAYHVSDTAQRRLFLVLQASGAGARVQVLGATAGPSADYGFVGHVSTLRYFLEHASQQSFVTPISPDTPLVVPLATAIMRPADLVAAIFDARVLAGDPVTVSVVTVSADADPLSLLSQPVMPGDGHGRRGEFDLTAIPPLALAYSVGGQEPPPFTVGVPVFRNLLPGGRPLGGDYGVLRAVILSLTNPTATPQNVYLYETPAGGTVTTTMMFSGDSQPTVVGCVDPSQTARYLVKAFALSAGESRTVTGEYMTDGTSTFPLLFGLTSTPPPTPPPTACGHAPAPTPSPSPSPLPSESPSAPPLQTPIPQPQVTASPSGYRAG